MRLDIVLPAHNEEARIDRTLRAYRDTRPRPDVRFLLRRAVVRDVLPRLGSRDLLFDVDLLAAARYGGWRVVEVPTVWIDQAGSRVSVVADSRRMGASLVRLWMRRRMRPGGRVR